MSDPRYARLAELADAERELAEAGRVDELDALAAERAALVAALPAQAPPGARAALEDALARQRAAEAALHAATAAARAELRSVDRGRQAARAYGAALKFGA